MRRSTRHSSCPPTRPSQRHRPRLDAKHDPLIGRLLDERFRLIERVGHGAYGAVYRAEQIALHRDVAIKVLDASSGSATDLAERFLSEARAVSRVRHPNTVAIYDFGRTDDGLLYLVMELIQGVTLTELIACSMPLPLPRVISLIAQVAMALEAIHLAGLAHADLKSDNLLVQPLPSGELIKVVDFGIAQRLAPASVRALGRVAPRPDTRAADAEGASELRIAPHVRGTPGYIAPEVIRGAAPDQTADIYAAGVVLYLLLTGELPFSGRHPAQTLRRQLMAPVLPPSLVRPDVPAGLDHLVLRATARDPGARYADVGEMRGAIEAVALDLAPGALPYALCPHTDCSSCGFSSLHPTTTTAISISGPISDPGSNPASDPLSGPGNRS
ncbi:MAG TPA: serine/threonine-protein kinase [Haliangium sp.]|nr:serine/threonine-protein kinase [Haliangium sp.]